MRALLLLSALAALAAFAAPAAQAAPQWYTTTGPSTFEDDLVGNEEEAEAVHGTGSISWSVPLTGFVNGPCTVHVSEAYVWNTATDGEGLVISFQITTPCPTNVPGCGVEAAFNNTETGAEWVMTTTAQDGISIAGVSFGNHYGAGCPFTTAVYSGTATGTANAKGCVSFVNAGDLKVSGVVPGILDGELCLTGSSGRSITLR